MAPAVIEPTGKPIAAPRARILVPRWRRWVVVGLMCAAVATVVLRSPVRESLTGWRSTREDRSELRDLVAALANETTRPVDGRLTGGFKYAPPPSTTRGAGDTGLPPDVVIAAARIDKTLRARPTLTASASRILGLAYLVRGDFDRAIRALEQATRSSPPFADAHSDLASAYLARSASDGAADDSARAVDAARRAVDLAPMMPDAQFNLALALERIPLLGEAKRAWERYTNIETNQAWKHEGEVHLQELRRRESRSAPAFLADETTEPQLIRLVRQFPQEARTCFEEELLPLWAKGWLSHRGTETGLRRRAELLASALSTIANDRMPVETVRRIQALSQNRDAARLDRAARGFESYGAARIAYEQSAFSEATRLFRAAYDDLSGTGNPFAAWSMLNLAVLQYHAGDVKGAADMLGRLADATPRSYTLVHGRILWVEGFLAMVGARYETALERFASSLAVFAPVAEHENIATLEIQIAEGLDSLGETEAAWRHRRSALEHVAVSASRRRRQAVFGSSSRSALDQRLPWFALHVASEALENAEAWGAKSSIAEARYSRARISASLDHVSEAADDIARARTTLDAIGAADLPRAQDAEFRLAEAEVFRRSDPKRAVASLDEALRWFQDVRIDLRLSRLFLSKARAQLAGQDVQAAEQSLELGISTFEKQRKTLATSAHRVSSFDEAWGLFAELIRLKAVLRLDSEGARRVAERSRGRTHIEQVAPTSELWTRSAEQVRATIPAKVSVIEYAVLPERLLVWVIRQDGIHFAEHEIAADHIDRLVEDYHDALTASADAAKAARLAEELFTLLVGPYRRWIDDGDQLVFVPDGAIHRVPFATLIDRATRRYLIEDFPVAVAPSVARFGIDVQRSQVSGRAPLARALVIGNPAIDEVLIRSLPPLPSSESEAAAIAALYPSAVLLTGVNATDEVFMHALPGSDIVHFGGHTRLNDRYPELSYLLLSPTGGGDGRVFAQSLDSRVLANARIVVLASCRTAAGRLTRGEGPMSFARQVLAAGVPAVVASLWDVSDRASQQLMTALHEQLARGGSPAISLRKAQLKLLKSGDAWLARPTQWGGFVAFGAI